MTRKGTARQGLELVATLPWPWGVGLAVVSWLVLRWFAAMPELMPHVVGTVLQWVIPPLLMVAALISWKRMRRATMLLRTTLDAAALRTLSWREFELLLSAAFEAHGFEVQDRGGKGADGGVDLVAKDGDRKYFIQCKHWKSQQVGVKVVRELAGIVAAYGAQGGYFVASGGYTREAQEFGVNAGLQLFDGPMLLEFLEGGRVRRGDSNESPALDFGSNAERNSRRVRIAVALAIVAVTLVFFGGSPLTESPTRIRMASRVAVVPAPRATVSAKDLPHPMPVDPVDLAMRRAEREQIADEASKEAAWAAEWKVAPECEHPVDWAAQVECGNRYIRARRAFEERWGR